MKKVLPGLLAGACLLAYGGNLNVTGSKTIAECRKTAPQQYFDVFFWAEGCKMPTWQAHWDWLMAKPDHFASLPPCDSPVEPLPLPHPPTLGVHLSQPIPDGYTLVDENITDVKQSSYPAFDGYGTAYTNFTNLHGYCIGLREKAWWNADVHQGIIETTYFTRTYRKECDQNDTDFPDLLTNQKSLFAWEEPTNRTIDCSDNNGSVQDRLKSCKKEFRCVGCTQPDTNFTKPADNEVLFFEWSEPANRTQECDDNNGTLYQAQENCTLKYQCRKTTDSCTVPGIVPVSSYISPKDGTFHEDITIAGTPHSLHYSSGRLDDTTIAHGWSIDTHATLDNDRFYLGGSLRIVTPKAEGNTSVVVYGASQYLFDVNGKHIQTRDLYTKQVHLTFGYDASGVLESITDRFGQATTLQRDGNGKLLSITAPKGQVTTLSIDDKGDLTEVRYENGSAYVFEYTNHLMTKETEPNGNIFVHQFDSRGSVVKVIDAVQGEWEFGATTQSDHRSIQVTGAASEVTRYKKHFLANGILKTEKILPTGDRVVYENSIDDTTSSTTSCGVKTTRSYKTANGTLSKDPLTQRRVPKATTVTLPSGLSLTTNYGTQYTYDGTALITKTGTVTQNGITTTTVRDYNQSTQTTISPTGIMTKQSYDPATQLLLSTQYADFLPVSYRYDTEGRITQITQGTRVTTYAYDDKGNLESITDPKGLTTSYSYDVMGRLTETTYPDGSTESYAYDPNGNLISRTVPTPAEHTFAYNGVNKRTGATSPLQKTTTYTYDKQRRVTKITKPSGKSIDTTYADGRITAVTTPEGTTSYQYSCQSTLASITNGSESYRFTYDGTLLTTITQQGILNQTLSFGYDSDFRISSFTYAGATTNYSYNRDGQLIQSGDFALIRDINNSLVTEMGDGILTQKRNYNSYGELTRLDDSVLTYQLFRDDVRITRKRETTTKLEEVGNNGKGKGKNKPKKPKYKKVKVHTDYRYEFDTRGRLTQVTKDKEIVEQYRYDSNGNRAWANVYGVISEGSYTLDDNLIVYGNNTYRYDDDGYLIEKTTPEGVTTYTYGTMGELKEVVTPDKTITYQHNANNQRVAKLINGQVVEKYLWTNLTTLLAVYDANDNLIQRFEYADQRMPVAMSMSGQKYYLHYDQVGSLRSVSRVLSPDGTFEVVKEITYDSFGNIRSDSNESFNVPFRFAGGLHDKDTGLVRFGYRDFDPFTGKWTAKDPIGFAGGDSNLYGYVLGDPVNGVDPEGLCDSRFRNTAPAMSGCKPNKRRIPIPIHGNWCGPNWTGGYPRPWDELYPTEKACVEPPVDPIDACCEIHDYCHADCRKKFSGDKLKKCYSRCDQKLCKCSLRHNGSKYGIPQYMCVSGQI